MKKVTFLIVAILLVALVSCDKECTQDAYCQLISSQDYGKTASIKADDKVFVCHNGITIEILASSLQDHLDHGDTEGECSTLSSTGLEFKDGEVVQIPCDYDLPFVHTTANGTQWWYGKPGDRY